MPAEILPFPAPESGPQTVGQVVQLFLRHTRAQQNARTYQDRKIVLDGFAAAHGHLALGDLKPFHLRLWVDGCERWKSDWTRKRVVGTVQRVFRWAVDLGLISHNPVQAVKQRGGKRGRPMEDGDFRAMLRSTGAEFRRVLIFLRYTGCRPGELSRLTWRHIDPERGVIVLHEHKSAESLADPKPRVIVLVRPIVLLLRWLARRGVNPDDVVMLNRFGRRWTRYNLCQRLRRLRKRLGIPKTCKLYGLRHKYGTDAVAAEVPLKFISELMGHSNTRMTEYYVHLAGKVDHLHDAADRIFRKKRE